MDTLNEKEAAKRLLAELRRLSASSGRQLRFMEVCGTHTVAIFRAGLRKLLPENIELVSGPGCPVCVTDTTYIDKAIAYAQEPGTAIATFGDMLKVPGSKASLGELSAQGAAVHVIYSPLDSLQIAKANPNKRVIFLAVGFETTAPTTAATALLAAKENIGNLYFLSAHKLVPPVLRFLLSDTSVRVDGFLLPGHVAVVTGTAAFEFLATDCHVPGVVAGFTPLQILRALCRLTAQAIRGEAHIANEYESVVLPGGNPAAQEILCRVYAPADAIWRGMGRLPQSGLEMRPEYARFDIEQVMPLSIEGAPSPCGCRCGEVLRGLISPPDCPFFAAACVPEHAKGPCMVSAEGVCAAWYKYNGRFFDGLG